MHISRANLIRVARETALKSTLSDPGLVAAYLTGSVRSDNPFLGNATDVDIVFVHEGEPKIHREIIALTPEIHLDIIHNPRSLYEKPKELRVHPWLGPELYDSQPLYGSARHFFEFIQAGVRDRYNEPENVLLRSRHLAEHARQIWMDLQARSTHGPQQLMDYWKSISLAANAIALLSGPPLAERRFLLQFPARAQAAGQPGLADRLSSLIGAKRVEASTLTGFLPDWEKAFSEASGIPGVNGRIAAARLGYYKQAIVSMLENETSLAGLWPLMLTWTLSMSVLPATWDVAWRSACSALGLDEETFAEKLVELDQFLDIVEGIQEGQAGSEES